jgi:hypothetical protein
MIKINRTIFIIGIIFVILLSILFTIIDNKHIGRLNREYNKNITDAENINSKIIKVEEWHGVSNITLDNGDKYFLVGADNYSYSKVDLFDYLVVGNKIVKKKGIDSLWVETPEGRFVFIVGESINRDKK